MLDYLFMGVGTFLCCVSAMFRHRTNVLSANLVAIALFAAYWAHQNQDAAFSLTMAGFVGSAVQLFTPKHMLEKTLIPRLTIAMGTALVGFAFHYHDPLDLIPLLGFSAARIGEVSSRSTGVRYGYLLSTCCWFVFAICIANPLAMATNTILLGVQSYASLRDLGLLGRLNLKFVTVKRAFQ